MVVDITQLIVISKDPLTFVLHSIAIFRAVSHHESLNYLPVRPHVNLCSRYYSLVTGIFPLLNQLQGLMFSRYPVVYAVNLTTRR